MVSTSNGYALNSNNRNYAKRLLPFRCTLEQLFHVYFPDSNGHNELQFGIFLHPVRVTWTEDPLGLFRFFGGGGPVQRVI